MGTDVAAGDSVLVTAVTWEEGRTQGILFCYGLDGSFQWELPLPGASKAMAVVAGREGSWVLWSGAGGWAVSYVDPDGRIAETYTGPEGSTLWTF